MCGIFGCIGESKNSQVTYDLLNKLFLKTEIRGTDATGFYGCAIGSAGAVMYDKEPKKASEYTKQSVWNEWAAGFVNEGVDMFIGHCRQTSVGGGPERINKNNHPHVSGNKSVAVVHNGKIPEFSTLKTRYPIESECDSEILLRMFESAEVIVQEKEKELKEEFPTLTPFLAQRMVGFKEIFAQVNYGAMAVAIAERSDDGSRYLWLFRDEDRPLHVVDMRETLGQIFFCSTPEIWRQVVEDTPSVKEFISQSHVIIEVPSYQVWLLALTGGDEPWNIRKFKITKTKYIDWKQSEDDDATSKLDFKKARPGAPSMEVLCRLGKNEEIVTAPNKAAEGTAPDEKKKQPGNDASNGSALATTSNGPPSPDDVTREPGEDYELVLGETVIGEAPVAEPPIPFASTVPDPNLVNRKITTLLNDMRSLKTKVTDKIDTNSMSSRDLSLILDQMETIRQTGGKYVGNV